MTNASKHSTHTRKPNLLLGASHRINSQKTPQLEALLEQNKHLLADIDYLDEHAIVFAPQRRLQRSLPWSELEEFVVWAGQLDRQKIPNEVMDAYSFLREHANETNKKREKIRDERTEKIRQDYPIPKKGKPNMPAIMSGVARQEPAVAAAMVAQQSAIRTMMAELDEELPPDPLGMEEMHAVELVIPHTDFASFAYSSILSEELRYKHELSPIQGICVARHSSMAALALYRAGLLSHVPTQVDTSVIQKPPSHDLRRKEANEPIASLLSLSPSFISKNDDNARAFKVLAEFFGIVYDERRGDGYEYELVPSRHTSIAVVPKTDQKLPPEIMWMHSCNEMSLVTDEMGAYYSDCGNEHHAKTQASERAFMGDMLIFYCTAPLLNSSDMFHLYDIADAFAEHRRVFQSLGSIEGEFEEAQFMEKMCDIAEAASGMWYSGRWSGKFVRDVYKAAEDNVGDWEFCRLLQQHYKQIGMDRLVERVMNGEDKYDVLRSL